MIANSIMAYMAMFRNGQDRSLQSKTLGPALTPNSYFLTPNLPFLRYYGQHRTIPALRLKHRSGSCGTASALPKCSIMSGCGTRIVLRFAVSATGGAHLCSIQYYLRFWLSSCRISLAVSALRIMRYCLKSCLCLRNIRHFLWLQIHLNLSGQWHVLRPAGRLRAGRGSHISFARPPRNLPAHRAQ